MTEREIHVVPHLSGWEVVISGREGSSVHATQREAHQRAHELARHAGGEVVVHARDGRIRESEIVAQSGREPSVSAL